MRSVSVGELRQNPTAAFDAVENGETLVVTRHNRPFAQIAPLREPRVRRRSGSEVMEWLQRHPLEPVDTSSWRAAVQADRAALDDQSSQDPWLPNP